MCMRTNIYLHFTTSLLYLFYHFFINKKSKKYFLLSFHVYLYYDGSTHEAKLATTVESGASKSDTLIPPDTDLVIL